MLINCEGCHITWVCSGAGAEIRTILTAAMLQNDELLQRWLYEVIQARKSKTIWHASSQRYMSTLNEEGDYDVLVETNSNIDAIQHAIGNPHR